MSVGGAVPLHTRTNIPCQGIVSLSQGKFSCLKFSSVVRQIEEHVLRDSTTHGTRNEVLSSTRRLKKSCNLPGSRFDSMR